MMKTRDALEFMISLFPNQLSVISSLGRTSEEVYRLFPAQTLFLDSMGDVSSIACGVALGLGKQYPVVAFDTDGSHLMGLSLLPTLGGITDRLSNLLIVVFDNDMYESAGGLPSRFTKLDWGLFGESFGLDIQVVSTEKQLLSALDKVFRRFTYIVIKVENLESLGVAQKTVDGIESKYLFARHLEKTLQTPLLKPSIKS